MTDTPGIGHNSDTVLQGAAQKELRSLVERIERIDQEKAEIAEQRKEVLSEAKGRGYDTKQINAVVKLRKLDRAKRLEELAVLRLYAQACGVPEDLV